MSESSSSNDNLFSNDGSFLEKYKQMTGNSKGNIPNTCPYLTAVIIFFNSSLYF